MARRKTRDAISIIDAMIGDDPEMRRMIAEEEMKIEVGQQAYDAREAAGMTRAKLAKIAGTNASAIEDLEEGDYQGDALAFLQRIASALGRKVEVKLVALPSVRKPLDLRRSRGPGRQRAAGGKAPIGAR